VAWWKRSDPDAAPDTGAGPRRPAEPGSDLERLAQAGTVAFGGVGIASTTLPETAAYLALGRRIDDAPAEAELRPELERLVATATPAGKVYAADLLSRLDPAAGRRAWERLADDPAQVSTFTGCVMGRTTLAEYARGRMNH